MHPVRRKRLGLVIFLVFGVSLAAGLIFFALKENMNLFYAPEKVAAGEAPLGQRIRIGGMVKKGSVQRSDQDLKTWFVVTDYKAEVKVMHDGILPDLFDEEQGVVAAGMLQENGDFIADEVLAKHDENYMPPEVLDALKDSTPTDIENYKKAD